MTLCALAGALAVFSFPIKNGLWVHLLQASDSSMLGDGACFSKDSMECNYKAVVGCYVDL